MPRLYLDHAATTPVCEGARLAVAEGFQHWANPSSPHADGRAARAMLEDARARICRALDWDGAVIFTSGASEAIALGLGRARAERVVTSPVEHDAVLRMTADATRLAVDGDGVVRETVAGALHAIQHVNNETGVIQPVATLAAEIHGTGGTLFVDCAQSAGKIALPMDADMIALSAHKFGGPPGVGALLVKDLAVLSPVGGQERGYRGGTENVPGVLGMAAALEENRDWMAGVAGLRTLLDSGIREAGGIVVADAAERIATIASYRMPGVSARVQLIRFDMAGVSVSAGAACSSGTLKTSPVLSAIGWRAEDADEVIRVSFGPQTSAGDIDRFLHLWQSLAGGAA
nr:aminotransferase class V-fold PLP-dependent enzyme [Sphingobium subterraneum]